MYEAKKVRPNYLEFEAFILFSLLTIGNTCLQAATRLSNIVASYVRCVD